MLITRLSFLFCLHSTQCFPFPCSGCPTTDNWYSLRLDWYHSRISIIWLSCSASFPIERWNWVSKNDCADDLCTIQMGLIIHMIPTAPDSSAYLLSISCCAVMPLWVQRLGIHGTTIRLPFQNAFELQSFSSLAVDRWTIHSDTYCSIGSVGFSDKFYFHWFRLSLSGLSAFTAWVSTSFDMRIVIDSRLSALRLFSFVLSGFSA